MDSVKILLVHAYYRQRGGEEEVFEAERALLEEKGEEVHSFTVENEELASRGRLTQAVSTIWNAEAAANLRRRIQEMRPDVVHVHNTFPALSPAAIRAARGAGVPIVQTLHNYRIVCGNGLFFRDGAVCELCLGRSAAWPGIVHRCYRDSRAASAVVAGMQATHRITGTWSRKVDRYIALSDFARDRFVAAGLPADRIRLKHNFVADPGYGGEDSSDRERFALFVGRLSPEKGLRTLLDAWECVPDLRLRIAGDGPLADEVARRIAAGKFGDRVEWLGRRSQSEVIDLMRRATILVFPSEWYESGPRVVLEAFACGLPIAGSAIGAMKETFESGRVGIAFPPGDPARLAAAVHELANSPDRLNSLRRSARQEYLEKHTPAVTYDKLMAIYREAIGNLQTS